MDISTTLHASLFFVVCVCKFNSFDLVSYNSTRVTRTKVKYTFLTDWRRSICHVRDFQGFNMDSHCSNFIVMMKHTSWGYVRMCAVHSNYTNFLFSIPLFAFTAHAQTLLERFAVKWILGLFAWGSSSCAVYLFSCSVYIWFGFCLLPNNLVQTHGHPL